MTAAPAYSRAHEPQAQLLIEWDADLEQTTPPPNRTSFTLRARFIEFHRANPHVYHAICSLARYVKGQGWPRAGMKQIFEQLRWKFAIKTKGGMWRLDNSFTAYYARLVMRRERDLAGFFEIRKQHPTRKERPR